MSDLKNEKAKCSARLENGKERIITGGIEIGKYSLGQGNHGTALKGAINTGIGLYKTHSGNKCLAGVKAASEAKGCTPE